jgi:hypothetical protein
VLRRRRAPESVRAVAGPGDRVVAWALTPSGEPVVATEAHLVLPGAPEPIAWHDVEKVVWSTPRLTVTVLAPGDTTVAGTGPAYDVELVDPGRLPDAVRTLVTGSVVWSSHASLGAAGGVRVVGRRQPGLEVFAWRLVLDAGTDVDDPLVREQAQALLVAARRSIG